MAVAIRSRWEIGCACAAAACVSPIGAIVPHGDVGAITSIWAGLLYYLAEEAKCKLTKQDALKIVGSILAGVGLMVFGIKTATAAVAYTGIGTVPAFVFNLGLNAVVTWVYGNAVAKTLQEQDPRISRNSFSRRVLIIMAQVFGVRVPDPV